MSDTANLAAFGTAASPISEGYNTTLEQRAASGGMGRYPGQTRQQKPDCRPEGLGPHTAIPVDAWAQLQSCRYS